MIGVMICAAATAFAIFDAIALPSAVPVFARDDKVLIIDAGHGGIDGGAIGVDGSKESDINLAIALKLRAIAVFYGLDSRMTRQDDSTLSSTDSYSEHSDLEERLRFAVEATSPVLISIHQNSYPTSQPSGSQVIYALSEESERLGKITHGNLISTLEPENRRVAEPATSRIFILSNADFPAILVECGFISSFVDIEKLTNDQYQSKIAGVILASYIQFTQIHDGKAV